MDERLRNLYNNLFSVGYHKGDLTHSRIFYPTIKQTIQKGNKILDIGCATGVAMRELELEGYCVFGVDISDIAVNNCVKRGLWVKQSYAHKLEYDTDMFDAVLCTDVLEHVPEENLQDSAKEMFRVLKQDGRIFIRICLEMETHKEKYQKIQERYGVSCLHLSVFHKGFWLDLFTANGFIIEEEISLNNTKWLNFIGRKT